MIEVTRYADRITVIGHANYAKSGEDIVCAGVSTLVQTLIQSVEELTADKIKYVMSPGTVDIKFWCLSDLTKGLIDAFFIGVKMIADNYPDNVKLFDK
jgi:uncharacterized protein YsxB (DUF464 family)